MSERAREFDVVVAGGGMAGAGVSLALAPLGMRIAIVEARPPQSILAPGYDDRCTALSAGSRRILDALGVWPALAPHAAAIRQVHVSECGRAGSARLDAGELALEALGWVIDNPRLTPAFDGALASCANISRLQPATVVGLRQAGDGVEVDLDLDGIVQTCRAGLLVGADGARSAVRVMAGIDSTTRDYGQTAVVANITPQLSHRGRAWERFTPQGPLAVLPLADHRCGIVWTVATTDADAVMALDDAAFADRLNALFGRRLGEIERVGRRQAWPLVRTLARRQWAGQVALVGNAAHSLHPIAGQGLNLSLRDCAALAKALADGRSLSDWAAGRHADQRRVGLFVDGLNGLFTLGLPLLGTLRGAGLGAFGLFGPGRRLLARYGAGIGVPLR